MSSPADESRSALLTRVAFGVAVAIVIARCLMLEVVRDPGTPSADAPAAPGPATSVFLDWLSLLPALLILIRRLADRAYTLRFSSAHWLFFALAAWAILSTTWADDRFLALVTSTRLLAAASLFWSFSQLVRRWDHLRVIAGVVLGLMLANVAQGALYRAFDFADLKAYWELNKAQILQERGWRPGDYAAGRFEMKLLAGEILGFNASPNVLGALVVLMSLVGLGAFAQRVADRDAPGWAASVGLASLGGLYLLANAGSKAAWGALALGVVLLLIGGHAWRTLAKQRALLLAAAGALVLLAVVTVVGVGLSRGNLFDASLTFRWRYWVGAWPLVLAHPVAGVGWSNFADHYLATRLPEATEEINDPHNALVRLAVELGAVGLALGVAGTIAWTLRATRIGADPRPVHEGNDPAPPRRNLRGILTTCAVALGLSVVTALDLSAGDVAYLTVEIFKRALLVGLIALGVVLVAVRSAADARLDVRPAPWIATGLFVGLAMLGLMSLIDVTFFQTGPLMLAATIAGALVGRRWRDGAPGAESLPLVALIVGGLGWVVMFVVLVVPVALAEWSAADARAAEARGRPDLAARSYAEAYGRWGPVRNVDYALRAAQMHVALPGHDAQARQWLDAAVAAGPRFPMARLTRARWLARRPDADARRGALDDLALAVAANPNDVDLRVEHADLLERAGRPADAAAQLLAALAVDDAMDPAEPERLRFRAPGQYEALHARAAALRAATTRPGD